MDVPDVAGTLIQVYRYWRALHTIFAAPAVL
jgi:hypothetical protein